MNRKVSAVLVLAGWLGIMGWMVRREYFRPRAELLAEAALNVAPGATYYSLELSGQQIGFASSSVDTLQDTVRVQDQMLLRIPAMGTIQRVRATTRLRTLALTARVTLVGPSRSRAATPARGRPSPCAQPATVETPRPATRSGAGCSRASPCSGRGPCRRPLHADV